MNKEVQKALQKKQFHKLYQPYWMYFLVFACEILTIIFALLPIEIQDQQKVDMLYTSTSIARIAIFLFSSIYLIGLHSSLFRLYFLADNNLLFVLGTSITYLVYNYSGEGVPFKYPAMIAYPLLIFGSTGNYRVMLIYCKWDRWQIILYKLLKLFGAVFFFVYGSYQTKNKSVQQPQVFLLFVFTTFAYYTQMYFGINRMDNSQVLIPDYKIKEKIESKRLVTKKLIQLNSFLDD